MRDGPAAAAEGAPAQEEAAEAPAAGLERFFVADVAFPTPLAGSTKAPVSTDIPAPPTLSPVGEGAAQLEEATGAEEADRFATGEVPWPPPVSAALPVLADSFRLFPPPRATSKLLLCDSGVPLLAAEGASAVGR